MPKTVKWLRFRKVDQNKAECSIGAKSVAAKDENRTNWSCRKSAFAILIWPCVVISVYFFFLLLLLFKQTTENNTRRMLRRKTEEQTGPRWPRRGMTLACLSRLMGNPTEVHRESSVRTTPSSTENISNLKKMPKSTSLIKKKPKTIWARWIILWDPVRFADKHHLVESQHLSVFMGVTL